ncbi:DUF1553 domain-containing protein [bacterium]|nr:DUF1553 domain-containing protein [bacterium]
MAARSIRFMIRRFFANAGFATLAATFICLIQITGSTGASPWQKPPEAKTLPVLRMTQYRGPGTTDRDLGPKVCDGDPDSEWIATGLTRTTLGPPFEFVFEAIDGRTLELAGLKVLSASAAPARRLADFEIRVESTPDSGIFDSVVYRGSQSADDKPQSHLFDKPLSVQRFQWVLRSNHGDRNEFRANEIWPIFDAAETARSNLARKTPSVPKIEVEPVDSDAAARYVYHPLKVEQVPDVRDADGQRLSPIDAWLARSLGTKKLRFSPPAEPETLVRRLCWNLTGLPPADEDIRKFRENPDERTYAELTEKYLNSTAYGENQARLWLDVVRYADTDGYAADGMRADAWRYRDYVIAAFETDKPFDRFLTEQLAADELPGAPTDALPALSMARLGPFRTNSGNQNLERNRQELITEMVSNVSLSFLGLTIGCARCHDHKIDPIPQADYYRFAAFFAAAEPAALPLETAARRTAHEAESQRVRRAMEPHEARIQEIRDGAARRLRDIRKSKLDTSTRTALEKPYDQRTDAEAALVKVVELELEPKEAEISAELTADERKAIAAEEARLKALRARRPAPLPTAWGLKDAGPIAPATYLLHRGEIDRKSGMVDPRPPSAFFADGTEDSFGVERPAEGSTTGRRLRLARWMTSQGQVARVIVNRIWQQHFGRGIVATANNFGELGEDPTHPELLDWLADDFVRHGWSIKRLHRQIVASLAFRQSSRPTAEALKADPLNELFSRQNRRRLTAEELRDGLLQISGELRRDHRGGPGIAPELPPEVLQRLKTAWRPTPDKNAAMVRSIYLIVDRNLVLPILEEFDQPDSMTSCARRNQSTHALQSLAMLNHPWIIERARAIGNRAYAAGATDAVRLAALYRHVTGRDPTNALASKLQQILARTKAACEAGADASEIWTDVALTVVNSVEWLYVE